MLTREAAWELVTTHTASASLRRHMLAVEASMRAYAPRFGGDAELWGTVGLLHDFDYEQNPDVAVDGHPIVGSRLLRELGVDEIIIRAILSHAEEITGVAPESEMEKALLAVDELTGFLVAVTLVRPSKSLHDVKLRSVRRKWKDRAFAAPVNRQEIEHAAARLGVPLEEHITVVLEAMQGAAATLGLNGEQK